MEFPLHFTFWIRLSDEIKFNGENLIILKNAPQKRVSINQFHYFLHLPFLKRKYLSEKLTGTEISAAFSLNFLSLLKQN